MDAWPPSNDTGGDEPPQAGKKRSRAAAAAMFGGGSAAGAEGASMGNRAKSVKQRPPPVVGLTPEEDADLDSPRGAYAASRAMLKEQSKARHKLGERVAAFGDGNRMRDRSEAQDEKFLGDGCVTVSVFVWRRPRRAALLSPCPRPRTAS